MLHFADLLQYSDVFFSGLLTTVELTVLTTILGIAVGTS